jgi:hypothetical protein
MKTQTEQDQGGREPLTLYVDYTLLQSSTGPCAAAYSVLRSARHALNVVYVPRGADRAATGGDGGRLEPPLLVTGDGEVLASLSDIFDWTRRAAHEQAACAAATYQPGR